MCSRDTTGFVALRICGLLTSDAFQRAKLCAETLHKYFPEKFFLPELHGLFDIDWQEYLIMRRRVNGEKWWILHSPVAVFMNERFIGSEEDLFILLPEYCVFDLPPEHVPYNIADYLNPNRSYCYMDIDIGGRHAGSFTFELYDDVVPKTCHNFRKLCVGEPTYEGSQIHRIAIPSFIQGGILKSGEVALFSDENFCVSHDKRGILSMANDGVHSNGSQFFIILSAATWMDHKYVAFGRLVEGAETLAAIEQIPTYYEMPTKCIQITACGLKYEAPSEPVEVEVTPKEDTPEMLVRSMLDEIIEKMTPTEPEVPDDRDAESVLTMEKYKRGEYSAGITEDMLSDVEPLDEDLPESLKIVWLMLREMTGNKTLIRCFARQLVKDIVEETFRRMRVNDAFAGLLAAFQEWPGKLLNLMALIRKVIMDTKRHIDILELGPTVVIVRELLDELLDTAIALIRSDEEMVDGMLEKIVTKSTVMSCVRNILSDMVNHVLLKQAEKELMKAEGFGEGAEKMPPKSEEMTEGTDTSAEEATKQEVEKGNKPATEETTGSITGKGDADKERPKSTVKHVSNSTKGEESSTPATEEKTSSVIEKGDADKEGPKSTVKDESNPTKGEES